MEMSSLDTVVSREPHSGRKQNKYGGKSFGLLVPVGSMH